jgi:hypothetical protein
MENLRVKNKLTFAITKTLFQKSSCLLIESGSQKSIQDGDFTPKNHRISQKVLKRIELLKTLDIKGLKMPLCYRNSRRIINVNLYLRSIKKEGYTLVVFLKLRSLLFKCSTLLAFYHNTDKEIINKVLTLKSNQTKWMLPLQQE